MLIQPVQPVLITIKIDERHFGCYMIKLSEAELEISCSAYLEKETKVLFWAKYFRGHGVISGIKFAQGYFIYTLKIEQIQFQPGLLINTRL